MASYTDNLKLLKKDPAVDGADTFNVETMLNENWDKIDAAVGAAQAADEYDPAKSYATGEYCTHDGTLYRCTAAAAAEEWNAAHWTATDVSAELVRLAEELAGKAAASHTHSQSEVSGLASALAGKATTVTLTATVSTGWTASGSYYYKQVSVSGMLSTDNPIADILPGSDNDANKLYADAWSKVQSIDTLAGAVKLWATAAPTTSFPVQFKVVR